MLMWGFLSLFPLWVWIKVDEISIPKTAKIIFQILELSKHILFFSWIPIPGNARYLFWHKQWCIISREFIWIPERQTVYSMVLLDCIISKKEKNCLRRLSKKDDRKLRKAQPKTVHVALCSLVEDMRTD